MQIFSTTNFKGGLPCPFFNLRTLESEAQALRSFLDHLKVLKIHVYHSMRERDNMLSNVIFLFISIFGACVDEETTLEEFELMR
jgi:hypothetical protein